MFLECRGSGAPTVVLIAGGFEAGSIWTYALTPGDLVHDAICQSRARVRARGGDLSFSMMDLQGMQNEAARGMT